MAQKTKAQLLTDLASNFPDNTVGAITAAIYRGFITDFLDSYLHDLAVVDVTASRSVTTADDDLTALVCTGATPIIITLDPASGFHLGFSFVVHRNGPSVTVTPDGSDTINGQNASVTINTDHNSILFVRVAATKWFALPIPSSLIDIPNGNFPKADGAGALSPSSLTETATQIISTKTLVLPPASVLLGLDGFKFSSAGQAAVTTDTSSRTGFLLTQLFNSLGTLTFNRNRMTAMQEITIQASKAENSPINPEFTYTVAAVGSEQRRHTESIIIESPDTGTGTYVIRQGNSSGPVIREGEMAVTADTEATVTFSEPMCFDVGTIVHVQIGGGIRLKGVNTPPFNPFIKVNTQLGYDDQIATSETMSDFAAELKTALETLTGNNRLQRSAIYQPIVEINDAAVTANDYEVSSSDNGKLLMVTRGTGTNTTISIPAGLDTSVSFFDIIVTGLGSVRLRAKPGDDVRINEESDLSLSEHEGARISKTVTSNRWVILFEKDITGPATAAPITEAVQHSGTGTINFGVELGSKVHLLPDLATGFDTLIGATIADNSLFVIVKVGNGSAEFDVSASGHTFGGLGSSNFHVIPENTAVLFYTSGTVIYPIANYAATGGAAGLTLLNDSGFTINRATPVVVGVNSSNQLIARVATTTILGTGVGPATAQKARVFGFAGSDIPNGSTFEPVVQGEITAWSYAHTPSVSPGDPIGLQIVGGELQLVITDTAFEGAAVRDVYGFAGYVVEETTADSVWTIYVDAKLVQKSHADRWIRESLMTEQAAMFEEVGFSGGVTSIIDNESLYNAYRNKLAVGTHTSTPFEFRLWNISSIPINLWERRTDTFGIRNSSATQTLNVRTFQTDIIFSANGLTIFPLAPGETRFFRPAPTGNVWQVLIAQRNDDGSYNPTRYEEDWYRDELDATSVNNNVRIHNRESIKDGDVRNHTIFGTSDNNPCSVRFEKQSIGDDQAWALFWSSMGASVPPIGETTDVARLKSEIAAAISWIETNINNGFDFQFNSPEGLDAIDSIGWISGNTIRYTMANTIPGLVTIDHEVVFSGCSNAVNNGVFAVTFIDAPNRIIHISNPSRTDGTDDEADSPGIVNVPIYCDAVLVSHDLRQTNFNCYENAARTTLVAPNPNWFDPDYVGAESAIAIGYSNGLFITESRLAIKDDSDTFFGVLGGPRGDVFYFDNAGGEYQNTRYLPLNYDDIHIRTDGTCNFFFDIHPEDLPSGERREFSVYSNMLNDDDDVTIAFGRQGNSITFDEGIDSFSLLNGRRQVFEVYNDGTESGVRIKGPFEKNTSSAVSSTVGSTAAAGLLTMSIAEILSDENEDPNFSLSSIGNPAANRIGLRGQFNYTIRFSFELVFNGTEPTGVSFVNARLVPTRLRSAVTTDIQTSRGVRGGALLFNRRGDNTSSDTKPFISIEAEVYIPAQSVQVDDAIGFDLRFDAFPTGFSVADLQIRNRQYSIKVQGGQG